MKPNAQFNKLQHQENDDEEKFTDAQHAALAKMMQGSPEASAPQTPSPPPDVTAPPAGAAPMAPKAPMPFQGIHAALSAYHKPQVPPATMKIAGAAPKKPFKARI